MPNLFELVATTWKIRAQNQGYIPLTATPDGALYVADYNLDLAIEGRVFHAFIGAAGAPVNFSSGFNVAGPQFVVDVPVATTIIPLRIQVYLQTSAGVNVEEIFAVMGASNVGAGTSTPVIPSCTRTDRPVTSECSLYSHYTVVGNAPVNPVELWHTGYNFPDATGSPIKFFEWTSTQDGPPQVIVGAGCLAIYINAKGSTPPTGYLRVSYIELPSGTLS